MGERSGDLATCVERVLARGGRDLVLAAPLGLGKPNRLLNAITRRVADDASRSLTLCTALSLSVPRPSAGLEKRFAGPFLARHFGADYPDLDYVAAMRAGTLPPNIRVQEFYFQSGAMLRTRRAQADYASLNYTFVARDLAGAGIHAIVQLVAQRGEGDAARYSLSSNPDVTLDLLDAIAKAGGERPLVVGVVHRGLPFLGGDAEVGGDLFDLLLDEPGHDQPLFALPREDVDDAEYAIGLHASTLVRDGGTLQIGIGALSDALVEGLRLRHARNADYLRLIAGLGGPTPAHIGHHGGVAPFQLGLYGSSEMVMDGFMHLRRAGILRRLVFDDLALQRALDAGVIGTVMREGDTQRLVEAGVMPQRPDRLAMARLDALGLWPEGHDERVDLGDAAQREAFDRAIRGRRLRGGRYLQGAFYLGSAELYAWLGALDGEDHEGLAMGRISHINRLRRGHEALAAVQRRDARFFNTCMMANLLGAAVSDTLDDGRVVSGVGGQYNFVAMAHELDGACSVLMLRATREVDGRTTSNLRWAGGQLTIPRHLRDVFVTEYGVADLRGRSDRDCIEAMLAICDARFIDGLVAEAVAAGKLPTDFRVPEGWRANTPSSLAGRLADARRRGLLPAYPFGSDFDALELRLLAALQWLRLHSKGPGGWLKLAGALSARVPDEPAALARMGLATPRGWRERLEARLVAAALGRTA